MGGLPELQALGHLRQRIERIVGALRLFEQQAGFIGRNQAATFPQEKLYPETRFCGLERGRNRGLGNPELARRTGDRAGSHYGVENLQVAKIHAASTP